MVAYSECQDCGFVLEARSRTDPDPKRREGCPDCGGAEFRLLVDH